MSFDAVFMLELGWLKDVWENGKTMLGNISYQLRESGLLILPDQPPMTNTEIEKVEKHIKGDTRHPALCSRRSLIAEYRKVWNLCRYAIGEGPSAALGYTDKIMGQDLTDAAYRLSEATRFQRMIRQLRTNEELHPKVQKLWELIPQLAGQQVLVLATQRKTVDYLRIGIKNRGYGNRVTVSTATQSENVDARVETILVYNAVSTDLAYLDKFMPGPNGQRVLLTINHPLDLGMRFYRPGLDVLKPSRRTAVILGGRSTKQKDKRTSSMFP